MRCIFGFGRVPGIGFTLRLAEVGSRGKAPVSPAYRRYVGRLAYCFNSTLSCDFLHCVLVLIGLFKVE